MEEQLCTLSLCGGAGRLLARGGQISLKRHVLYIAHNVHPGKRLPSFKPQEGQDICAGSPRGISDMCSL